MIIQRTALIGSLAASVALLSACNSATTEDATTPAPSMTTGTQGTTPNSGGGAVPVPNGLTTAGVGPSTVAVLTLNQGAGSTGAGTGQYDHTPANVGGTAVSGQATIAGTASGIVVPTGRRYVGFNSNLGSQNRVVALETAPGDVPTSNAPLVFSGKANVTAIDAANGVNTTLTGMDATITANFGGDDVDISLTQGGNTITINNLDITGSRFAHKGTSTASVSAIGFAAAYNADNNNATADNVSASGVFAGPNAAEVGAVAIIQKNGLVSDQALISLTGGQ